jgi:uncharacterized protein YigE (DUF2233 family)
MPKFLRTIGALMILMLLMSGVGATPTLWQTLSDGLQYTVLQSSTHGKVYAFRLDPTHYKLSLVFAHDIKSADSINDGASISQLAKQSQALVAVNGGFFTPTYQPLGLRIQEGLLRNPLKPVSWWGVFYIRNHMPYIVTPNAFKGNTGVDFAVQSGPRLVINGAIPSLKNSVDDRTALCITKQRQIIVIATQGSSLSMHDFANLLSMPERFGGLACYNALNLDGGHSTQLYAQVGDFKLSIPNLSPIADAVIVVPRNRTAEAAQAHVQKFAQVTQVLFPTCHRKQLYSCIT